MYGMARPSAKREGVAIDSITHVSISGVATSNYLLTELEANYGRQV